MESMLFSVFNSLLTTSIVSVVLLQFLPYRYTVTEGTATTINTWRPMIWGLP
jgi:hypothetical protein